MHDQVFNYQDSYETRNSWSRTPRSTCDSFASPRGSSTSAFDESRFQLTMEDMGLIRDQMKIMKDRVESMSYEILSDKEILSRELIEQNNRLHQTVSILETRLMEAESTFQLELENERNHLQSILIRSKRDYELEIDSLRKRHSKLEEDLCACITELNKTKLELSTSEFHLARTIENLNDVNSRVSGLKKEILSSSTEKSTELRSVMMERDKAIDSLALVENATLLRLKSSPDGDESAVVRIGHLQTIIGQLQTEKNELSSQLSSLNEHLHCGSDEIGLPSLFLVDNKNSTKLEEMTKLEVVNLLTQERYANHQLKSYLSRLLNKIMARHPDILEQS